MTNLIFRKDKVLIVDDIPKWIETTKNNLIYYGCLLENIVTTGNTKEAFRKHSEQRPNFIITDINFDINDITDVQGLFFIKKLRDNRYQLPIVAMSTLTEIRERTRRVGANYFIDKHNFTRDFDGFVNWYTGRQSR